MKWLTAIALLCFTSVFSQTSVELNSKTENGYFITMEEPKKDTVPSRILISSRPPSFGHSIDGYCIYVWGRCTRVHLIFRRKKLIKLGPQHDVWMCNRRDNN